MERGLHSERVFHGSVGSVETRRSPRHGARFAQTVLRAALARATLRRSSQCFYFDKKRRRFFWSTFTTHSLAPARSARGFSDLVFTRALSTPHWASRRSRCTLLADPSACSPPLGKLPPRARDLRANRSRLPVEPPRSHRAPRVRSPSMSWILASTTAACSVVSTVFCRRLSGVPLEKQREADPL